MNGNRVTTDELVARLVRVGSPATRQSLADDVRAGYLPHTEMDPHGPRAGIGRLWEPWAARRASYLYRLRVRGAKGDRLRLLLFLRDGWGWSAVRDMAVDGLEKINRFNRRGVNRHLRNVTPKALETIAEDYAEENSLTLYGARLLLGMGMLGSPLPQGSIEPLINALVTEYGDDPAADAIAGHEGGSMLLSSGATWERTLEWLTDATPDEAERARTWSLFTLARWRRRLRRSARRHGSAPTGTNLLTFCAQWEKGLLPELRQLPRKPTATQALAALLVLMIAADRWDPTTAKGKWHYWKGGGSP